MNLANLKLLLGKHRLVFYLVSALILIGEGWFFATFLPGQVSQLQVLGQNSRDLSSEVAQLDKGVAILTKIDKKQLSLDLAKVTAVLPSQKKTSGLVRGISGIASQSGVFMKSLEFSPGKISTQSAGISDEAVAGTKARMMLASVVVNGSFSEQLVFLTKLQAANQLLGVANFNFSGSAVKQPFSSLSLQVYYEPVESGKVDWKSVRPLTSAEIAALRALNSPDVFVLPEEQR